MHILESNMDTVSAHKYEYVNRPHGRESRVRVEFNRTYISHTFTTTQTTNPIRISWTECIREESRLSEELAGGCNSFEEGKF